MTVESTTTKQSFILNGVTKTFNFTFRALAQEHIKCQIISTTGDVEELTYETDYSVSLLTLGGTVTLEEAGTNNYTLLVYRETEDVQESDYEDYNQFPADTVEEDFDRRTMRTQEIEEKLDRVISLPISSTASGITLPDPEAGKIIQWKDDLTGFENVDPAEKGDKGDTGDTGEQGEPGVGVPSGGTTGQFLTKSSNEDFETEWSDEIDPLSFHLDQETDPQDVVPIAGTTFSLTSYDVLPTLAPGAFTVPAIAFTNSNAVGYSDYIGAIRGGLLVYSADGTDAVMGLIHDFEAGQAAVFGYVPDSNTLELGINTNDAKITFTDKENSGGEFYPVLGGVGSDGGNALYINGALGMWDGDGAGFAYIVAISQDFSTTSNLLVWASATEELSYSGAGGYTVNTDGADGTTTTPLRLSFKSIGDGHDNDGMRIAFRHRSDLGTLGTAYTAGYIDCVQTDASATTMASYLALGGYTAGATGEWLRLSGAEANFSALDVVTTGTVYCQTMAVGDGSLVTQNLFRIVEGSDPGEEPVFQWRPSYESSDFGGFSFYSPSSSTNVALPCIGNAEVIVAAFTTSPNHNSSFILYDNATGDSEDARLWAITKEGGSSDEDKNKLSIVYTYQDGGFTGSTPYLSMTTYGKVSFFNALVGGYETDEVGIGMLSLINKTGEGSWTGLGLNCVVVTNNPDGPNYLTQLQRNGVTQFSVGEYGDAHGALDSSFGSATEYWTFGSLDFGEGVGSIPLLSATNSEFILGTSVGAIADYMVIYDNSDIGQVSLAFVLNGLSAVSAFTYNGTEMYLDTTLAVNGYIETSSGFIVDGVSAVADGTYTVGKGTTTDGTITVKGGIITAVQEATN